MTARLEHRNAGDLIPEWIGQSVTVNAIGGPVTGVLSDYLLTEHTVFLFFGGLPVMTVWPSAKLTLDTLGDALGGESRG